MKRLEYVFILQLCHYDKSCTSMGCYETKEMAEMNMKLLKEQYKNDFGNNTTMYIEESKIFYKTVSS